MKNMHLLGLAAAASLAASTWASAAIIAQYDFNTSLAPISPASSAYAVTNVTGIGTEDTTNHVLRVGGDATPNDNLLSSALTANSYASFTVTPSAGQQIALSSLTFDEAFVSGTGSAAGALNINVAVFSSATGFTAADALATFSDSVGSASTVA